MVVVGLTGSIGTGKSAVASMFRELGAYVIDFDDLSRDAVLPDTAAWKKIVETFGEEVLNKDRTINRDALGRTVFNDNNLRRRLESIIFPVIFKLDVQRTKDIASRDPSAIIIKDIPLLIENGMQKYVDCVIVVSVSREVQISRLMERDGMSRDEAEHRISLQMPVEEKIKFADYVIDNGSSLEETRRQVENVYAELKSRG